MFEQAVSSRLTAVHLLF